MLKRAFVICSAAAWSLSGCATSDPATEAPDQDEQNIVRGTVVPVSDVPSIGRPYVVLVQFETFDGRMSLCSGSYFAPRVVLTAAHCVPPSNIGRALVYWGNDWEADLDLRFDLPPPGQPSVWANLDSWQVHPNYVTNPYDADMAVVYLDRAPPFDPLPLYRNRLDSSWFNQLATIVGWGANKALSEDIQITEGFGVKRTGRAPILGTPTENDYSPDDAPPGAVTPAVREHYVKLNGRNPYPNACSGDSGGPIIVNRSGQDYIAGVASRTGSWCENLALYTRIDPYLPFLDEAYRRGGQLSVVPSLDCVDTRANGTLTAYFGYRNENGVSVSVPYGTNNYLPLDTENERPTLFKPGDNRFQLGIDFTAGQTVYWKLNPPSGPLTELRVTAASPRCEDSVGRRCARYCEASLASECADDFDTNWESCITACVGGYDQFVGTCEDEWISFLSCVASTPPAIENWTCLPWRDDLPRAHACDPLIEEALECLYPPSP